MMRRYNDSLTLLAWFTSAPIIRCTVTSRTLFEKAAMWRGVVSNWKKLLSMVMSRRAQLYCHTEPSLVLLRSYLGVVEIRIHHHVCCLFILCVLHVIRKNCRLFDASISLKLCALAIFEWLARISLRCPLSSWESTANEAPVTTRKLGVVPPGRPHKILRIILHIRNLRMFPYLN